MGLSPTHGPDPTPVPRVGAGVVWDLGNVLVDWDASRAIAAGVGEAEAADVGEAEGVWVGATT